MCAPADGRACCLRLVLSCLCCLSVANVPARFACCAIVSGRGMFARRVLSQAVCIVNIAAGGAAVCGVKQGE